MGCDMRLKTPTYNVTYNNLFPQSTQRMATALAYWKVLHLVLGQTIWGGRQIKLLWGW